MLHDLRRPESSTIAIANSQVSGRRVGTSIVGAPVDEEAIGWLHKPGESGQMHVYKTQTDDGRQLKSATIVYRDLGGQPMAALCINYDLSDAIRMEQFIAGLTGTPEIENARPQGDDAQPADIEDILAELIDVCLVEAGGQADRMNRQQRFRAVQCLDGRGVFLIRGAIQRVAKSLGVSKFTIYSYLEEIRSS